MSPTMHYHALWSLATKIGKFMAARTKIAQSLSSKMDAPEICSAFCSAIASSICWRLTLLICQRTNVHPFFQFWTRVKCLLVASTQKKLGDVHGIPWLFFEFKGGWIWFFMGLICYDISWYWRLHWDHWDRWIAWRILPENHYRIFQWHLSREPIIWDVEPPQSQDKAHGCVDKYL